MRSDASDDSQYPRQFLERRNSDIEFIPIGALLWSPKLLCSKTCCSPQCCLISRERGRFWCLNKQYTDKKLLHVNDRRNIAYCSMHPARTKHRTATTLIEMRKGDLQHPTLTFTCLYKLCYSIIDKMAVNNNDPIIV